MSKDDIYVYEIPMPLSVRETVTPCDDGYTIYINRNISEERKKEALAHAMKHIENGDLEDDIRSVNEKELALK